MTPKEAGCDCANCPYSVKGEAREWVGPSGPSRPLGVVFCDLPTFEDARKGEPMVSGSQVGREWEQTLAQAGLAREKLLHVPATACRRPHGSKDRDVKKAIAACAPMRAAGKALADGGTPTLVLGQFAWQALKGTDKGHADARGFYERNIVTTFRPELAYFWAPHEWAAFDIDVARFGRMIRGELAPMPTTRIRAGLAELTAVRERALREGYVCYDIETLPETWEEPWTGKDPTRAKFRTLSFGWPDVGYSFFWNDVGPETQKQARLILGDTRYDKVGINVIWFDNRVLARYGIEVCRFEDCRDLRRALSSTSRLSLAYLATLYTDAEAWKSAQDDEAEDDSK